MLENLQGLQIQTKVKDYHLEIQKILWKLKNICKTHNKIPPRKINQNSPNKLRSLGKNQLLKKISNYLHRKLK